MARQGPAGVRVLWLTLMFLVAALITIAAFLTFVGPSERGSFFYVWMAVVCAAEFVFFAWAANWSVSRLSRRRASGAALLMIHVMIAIWLAITMVFAFGLAPRQKQSSNYADKVALAYAALTFVFFFGAYSLYSRDVSIAEEDRVIQAERRDLRLRVADVEQAIQSLREEARRHPQQAVAFDRSTKRLDALRTSLDYAPPGKAGTLEEAGPRHTDEINAEIIKQVNALSYGVAALAREGVQQRLTELDAIVSRLESLLRRRQQQLL